MTTDHRKLLTVICEAELESRLAQDVMRLGAHGYTVTDARGRGAHGVRDAAWEATLNIRMEVVCEAQVAAAIAAHLRKTYYDNYAMILFIQDVEVLRPEKF
ncbi:MAG: transcriptional regulator [Azospira oryzae]|uniref:Transcriptional regulator n=1 Tax=Pelomicrobium methylotrophicum TaxID=2602750 RepID=A0A5C7EMY4_9PROT|nr:transcriptional regulator [Pelomicrobium methylotrophicum]PZP61221.1 MAG: transcriptional regulator [Azospira oryzae]PZP81034.1 MAG: transcriptional regulator [Azospira oryzae]TXF12608.1 transcriptional regulator [Pelomicrobium methylotrophicum]